MRNAGTYIRIAHALKCTCTFNFLFFPFIFSSTLFTFQLTFTLTHTHTHTPTLTLTHTPTLTLTHTPTLTLTLTLTLTPTPTFTHTYLSLDLLPFFTIPHYSIFSFLPHPYLLTYILPSFLPSFLLFSITQDCARWQYRLYSASQSAEMCQLSVALPSVGLTLCYVISFHVKLCQICYVMICHVIIYCCESTCCTIILRI